MEDLINGLFELLGGVIVWINVRRLYKDKEVRGVSWAPTLFFSAWGVWNLYYYTALGQPLSFWGGLGLVIANTVWLLQMVYYLKHPVEKPVQSRYVASREGRSKTTPLNCAYRILGDDEYGTKGAAGPDQLEYHEAAVLLAHLILEVTPEDDMQPVTEDWVAESTEAVRTANGGGYRWQGVERGSFNRPEVVLTYFPGSPNPFIIAASTSNIPIHTRGDLRRIAAALRVKIDKDPNE